MWDLKKFLGDIFDWNKSPIRSVPQPASTSQKPQGEARVGIFNQPQAQGPALGEARVGVFNQPAQVDNRPYPMRVPGTQPTAQQQIQYAPQQATKLWEKPQGDFWSDTAKNIGNFTAGANEQFLGGLVKAPVNIANYIGSGFNNQETEKRTNDFLRSIGQINEQGHAPLAQGSNRDSEAFKWGQSVGTAEATAVDVASMMLPGMAIDKAVKGTRLVQGLMGGSKLAKGVGYGARILPGSIYGNSTYMAQQAGRNEQIDPITSIGIGTAADLALPIAGKVISKIPGVKKAVGEVGSLITTKLVNKANNMGYEPGFAKIPGGVDSKRALDTIQNYQDVLNGRQTQVTVAKITPELSARIKQELNVDVKPNAPSTLNKNNAVHIENRHGINSADPKPLDDTAIGVMPSVIEKPDKITRGVDSQNNPRIKMEKRISQNRVAVVEVIKKGDATKVITYFNDSPYGRSDTFLPQNIRLKNEGLSENLPNTISNSPQNVNINRKDAGFIKIPSKPTPQVSKTELPIVGPRLGKSTPKVSLKAAENNKVKIQQGLDVSQPKSGAFQDNLLASKKPVAAGQNTKALPSFDTIISPDGKNVSGLAKTIAKSDPEIAKIIPGFDRITNNKTFNGALKRVKADPNTVFSGLLKKGKNLTVNDTADAYVLLKKFIQEDNIESASVLAKSLAKDSREAGRIVQLASTYNKLTPEGAMKEVYKNIQDFKDKTGKEIPIDTGKIKRITELAKEVQKYEPNSRDWQKAAALLEKEKDVLPNSFLGVVSKIQTMAQLLNPKTAIRNIVGNKVLDSLEDVVRLQAAGIDKALNHIGFTKQRNIVFGGYKTKWANQLAGFKMGAEDVNLGIRTTGSKGQFQITRDIFKPGSVGNKLEKALGYELSAFDKAFYTGRYASSLENIVKANKNIKPKQWMIDQAEAEALYATFQNNSVIASGLQKVKGGLNVGKEWGVGDLILKYPKTPGNIVSVGLDYSPIGFMKGLKQFYDSKKLLDPGMQREAILNLSRGVTGTGLILGGAMLAKNGIITGKSEKDPDIRQAQREAGQGPFSFNFSALGRLLQGKDTTAQNGDITANYDWLQPNAMQLSMGANMVINKGSVDSTMSDAWDSLGAGIDTATQQPVFSGVQKFIGNLDSSRGGGVGKAISETVKGIPSSFVPSLSNQIGQSFDNTQRSTYDPDMAGSMIKSVQAKIPGLRNSLEPKISPSTGKPMEQYADGGNNIFNVYLNPAFVKKYNVSPEAKEVIDIFNRSGETKQTPRVVNEKLTINGEQKVLTPQEVTKYQEYVGTKTQQGYSELVKSPDFMKLDDASKAKIMSNLLTDINSQAKTELFGATAKTVSTADMTPVNRYQTNLAKYKADKAAGLISESEDITKQRELSKESITSEYSQDVLDFYKLSKADQQAYFDKDRAAATILYDQAKLMDAKLVEKGLATTKFSTKAKSSGTSGSKSSSRSGNKSSGKSTSKAPAVKKGTKLDYAKGLEATYTSALANQTALRNLIKKSSIKRKVAKA